MENKIFVTVAYALPEKQWLEELQMPQGSTVREALQACQTLPSLDFTQHPIGIYGKQVSLEHQVQDHDRIEIYRPLIVDPKTARRLRVKKQ